MVFAFAPRVAAVVKPPSPAKAQPLAQVLADWLKKAKETPVESSVEMPTETPAESPSETETPVAEPTRLQSQSQRVRAELPEKVPPLLSLVFRSVASETHLTFRLAAAHAGLLAASSRARRVPVSGAGAAGPAR